MRGLSDESCSGQRCSSSSLSRVVGGTSIIEHVLVNHSLGHLESMRAAARRRAAPDLAAIMTKR